MKNENGITVFEVGTVYTMGYVGDSQLKPQFICTKRTAKTVTFEEFKGTETLTRRIKEYNKVEFIREGSYSMAPSIYADKVAA